ncbi:Sugar kinase of the NBD/HSP70 family, may contain an N-terminal HTH domain [Kaistia soli DSM 19436]|uniref:Sugar kinase of the NBD/HSP70 family, may contain an N-terminal HTH domain n=1 Tax=Kaistia soli DSM 19436 TaxID=1122133 RepID=A0A1M5C2P8_9HYPH|nr:ROK family transcriptional regulator [Kaistia soli]SHF48961.1 Sugar kinase of the NBD/HSP70 family, may contain an N-terminal HTH domain [Kaistia soli DSM 19436]
MEQIETDGTTAALTGSARAVFRRLVEDGPSTRPQIGNALHLSRPTMSAAIAELERPRYVEMIGAVQGSFGRSAAQYRVGSGAGHVIAVDAGSTHVRVRVSTLDRRLLASRILRLPASQIAINEEVSRAVAAEVAAARAAALPGWGPLRVLGLALPTRVVGLGGDVISTRQEVVFSAFTPPPGVTLVLENNVNCAAVAEQHYGAARGASGFAYVQIGLKIGMGLVLGDQLIRGRNGAAGEIGHLSFPFAPGASPVPGEAEHYLGTEAFIGRVRADWPEIAGPSPIDTAELLSMAESGNADALRHVERHASDIGAVVATCVSVVDPGLVVLGGGLGASPLLLPGVREAANRLSYPVEIRNTLLGTDATVMGIERLAIEAAMTLLIGEEA